LGYRRDLEATLKTPIGDTVVRVERGVRQGDVLSPILFTLFINILLTEIETRKVGYRFTKNQSIMVKTEETVKIVKEFGMFYNIEINNKKSAITTNNRASAQELREEGDWRIPVMNEEEEYKDLGIWTAMK